MDGGCGVQYSWGWIILHLCNQTHSAQHPHACCLYLMVLEQTQFSYSSVSADEAVHGSKERVLLGHWRSGDEYWTRRKARQKMGKGQSNRRRPSPLFAPFAPAAKSIVHTQCHLGFPHPCYHIPWHICLGFLLSWGCSDRNECILQYFSTLSYLETKSYSLKPKSLSLPNYYPQNIACPRFSQGWTSLPTVVFFRDLYLQQLLFSVDLKHQSTA